MIVISFFFFFTKLSSGRINGISVFIPRKWERKREECDTALVGES